MNKQPKVFLIRYPLCENGFPYHVTRTQNLIDPEVGIFLDTRRVKELCLDPTIEVEISICEAIRR